MKTPEEIAAELQKVMVAQGLSVQTVGVGEDAGRPVLIVYVGSSLLRFIRRDVGIPKTFGGLPVKIIPVGTIRPAPVRARIT